MRTAYENDTTFLDFNADNAAAAVSADIVPVVLESIAFGFYTMLALVSFLVILRSHKELLSRKTILLAVCAAMYGAAAVHMGITLALLFVTKGQLDSALCMDMMECTPCNNEDPTCPGSQWLNPYLLVHPMVAETLPTALLALNMALGDLVVLWRALVLWPRRRAVQAASALLMAGTLGMLGWTVVGDFGFQDYNGSVAMLTSWVTNVWGTALITVRAWQHRRRVGAHLQAGSRSRAEVALLIFIESGALYCALWVPLIVSSVAHLIQSFVTTYKPSDNMLPLLNGVSDVQSGLLIHIVGIYPTAVILLVKLSDHYAQRTLSLNDVPTLLPQHRTTVQPQQHRQARGSTVSSDPAGEHTGRAIRNALRSSDSDV
ncbi:hypothetical protein PsYK624_033220 [Phanerochaete sordida]|uniref:Uncharacterized protein n=1 Tax=Phanerochaete sordida TaxID=48140 RepID=A0A9P3G3L0_9APHY|nr:hypothetical protein PsYK624_033220 [Phanerochaete sordida]